MDVYAIVALTVLATVIALRMLNDPFSKWQNRNLDFIKWVRTNRTNYSSIPDLRRMYELNTRPISMRDAPVFFDRYIASTTS